MSKSLSFRFQLSSIMEIMTKTAIEEICNIVESELTLLRQELSFVMSENRVLKDKMLCVENKGETASKTYQSTCVQTEGMQPSVNGIFGKEWCTSLWDQKIQSTEDELPDAVDMYPESQYKHIEPIGSIQPLIKEENRSEEDTYPNYEGNVSEGLLLNSSVCEPSADPKKYNQPFESDEIQRTAFDSSDGHIIKNTVIDNPVEQLMAPIEDPLIFDDHGLLDTFSVEQNVPPPSETQKVPLQKKETVKPKLSCYEGKMCLRPNATKHKVTKHKQQPPVKLSKSKPNRRYHCEICGRGFACKTNLKIHFFVHTGERPHKCTFCGKGFTQIGALHIHERTHTGERPFKCDTCGRCFTQKICLQNHERIHSGERPFICDTCGMTFAQKVTMDKHLIVHNKPTKKKQRKSKKYK
nr:zinc finger and SCAN domain-containing protein 12-like isoform X1 [Misgurnus anguillicaudatus]